MKNPVVAAFANAVIPGLGYVLLGRRKSFGWLLLGSLAALTLFMLVDPTGAGVEDPFEFIYATTVAGGAFEILYYVLGMTAFGYDAYQEAQKVV